MQGRRSSRTIQAVDLGSCFWTPELRFGALEANRR
nr:hypothetical protein [Zea mays]